MRRNKETKHETETQLLKLIVAQGEVILNRLEAIDVKIEKARQEREENDGERTGAAY